ncbi:MGMT family protein [Candidatus Saccharibacteria bacterium]|nr:MGMT family protein [Candidatus Saccharibacteria bacterium]
MAKKSFNEKLNTAGDLPKIEDISDQPKAVEHYGGTKMLIAEPMAYNNVMAKIPKGNLTTTVDIRTYLAKKAKADFTCPLTAGIFTNIAANASEERAQNQIPFWRTLRTKGELNEKYPGGIAAQKQLLQSEGHKIIQKGKRYFVENYESKLISLEKLLS